MKKIRLIVIIAIAASIGLSVLLRLVLTPTQPPTVTMPFSVKRNNVFVTFVNMSTFREIVITYDWRNSNQTILINKDLTWKNWEQDDLIRRVDADEGCKFAAIWIEFQNTGNESLSSYADYGNPKIAPFCVEMKDREGYIYHPTYFVQPDYLGPGEKIARWALFQIPEGTEPTELRIYEMAGGEKDTFWIIKIEFTTP